MNKYLFGNSPANLFVLIMVYVIVFFAVAVWPFYNLVPEYVSEQIRVASNVDGECYIHTDDNFMIPAGDAVVTQRQTTEF